MAKLKLTQSELAALDALIAELHGDHKVHEVEVGDIKAFITVTAAIARTAVQATKIAIRATPYVADATEIVTAILGKEANDEISKELKNHAKEGLSLDKLIELRKKFH